MRDPVTGFDYPAEWVEKCEDPVKLDLVDQGLAVLTSSGTVLQRGFTTGTTAAAACKASVLSLQKPVDEVSISIPSGLVVTVPVESGNGRASCRKFSGDYPSDVTANLEFVAEARAGPEGIQLVPGEGIGIFSRTTPRYAKGVPAISEAPLACILASIQEALDEIGISGVSVSLCIPEGRKVAEKTLNPRMGVVDGISVLGTTGLVEPWDDHLEESMAGQIAAADRPVLTTGRVGLRYSRLLFPDRTVILIGGKLGPALHAVSGEATLCGLPALILRHIRPGLLEGTGYGTVEEFSVSPGFNVAARAILAEFKKTHPNIRVILINREGKIMVEIP
jgi:cobalt-precorrin-5B (C1)-methyltransferase